MAYIVYPKYANVDGILIPLLYGRTINLSLALRRSASLTLKLPTGYPPTPGKTPAS
jgi:hypothetical protein